MKRPVVKNSFSQKKFTEYGLRSRAMLEIDLPDTNPAFPYLHILNIVYPTYTNKA